MTTPKPSKLATMVVPFTMEELRKANADWGCTCGPAALACMLNLKPDDVRPAFRDYQGYVTPTMMERALRYFGIRYSSEVDCIMRVPYGLWWVQFDGPWMNPGVPIRARYKHTHWVGTGMSNLGLQYVFDFNSGWETLEDWKRGTAKKLQEGIKRCTGFHVAKAWRLSL